MRSTFEEKEELRAEENQALPSFVISVRDELRNRNNPDAGKAWFAPTQELVMEYLQSNESCVWLARILSWYGRLACLACGHSGSGPEQCISVIFSKNWRKATADMAGRGGSGGAQRSRFQVWRVAGKLLSATGEVSEQLYVTPGSFSCVHYIVARKEVLREVLVVEIVEILGASVFLGHGYVQHACSEWQEEHFTRYHTYLIPDNQDLLDLVAFSFGHSTALGSEKPR